MLVLALGACRPESKLPTYPNSAYTDIQPALSGNGRFLAFTSSRAQNQSIFLYDLEEKCFLAVAGLNHPGAVAESPSLSYSARYIAYLSTAATGRPEIQVYDRTRQSAEVLTLGYLDWFRAPSISPDGRYVAFETGNQGQWDVAVFDRGPQVELDN